MMFIFGFKLNSFKLNSFIQYCIMSDNDYIYLECPHCNQMMGLVRQEINCAIYRHGVYKDTGEQMDPHEKQERCEYLAKNKLIYGCGKPFQLFENKNPTTGYIEYYIEKCDYI